VRSERRRRRERLIGLRKEREGKRALSGNKKAAFFSSPKFYYFTMLFSCLFSFFLPFYITIQLLFFYSSFHFPKSNSKCFKSMIIILWGFEGCEFHLCRNTLFKTYIRDFVNKKSLFLHKEHQSQSKVTIQI